MADPVSMLVMVGISLATTAAQMAISYFFPADGPRLKDLTVSASTYGNPIPEVWGTVRVGGNMIWSSGVTEVKQEEKNGLSYANSYSYTADFAMAFCRGPVSAIRRIWANGKLVYDGTGESSTTTTGNYTVEFHYGDESQLPDTTIAAVLGTETTPPYRGTCYAVFKNFLLTDFNNQIPQMAAEVVVTDETALVPAVLITSDGTAELTDYSFGLCKPLAVDFSRGWIYLYRFSDKSMLRVNLSTGILDKVGFPVGDTDSVWADGTLGTCAGVATDGSITCIFSAVNNFTQHGQVDPSSLLTSEVVGHAEPYGDLFPSDFEFPYTPDICFDGANKTYLGMTFSKNLVFLDPLTFYAGAQILGLQVGTGNEGTTLMGPGPGISQWVFLIQNMTGFFSTSLTLTGYGVVPTGTIFDPDAGNGSINISPDGVAYDVGRNYVICFYSTSIGSNYATAISVETGSVIWTTKLPHGPSTSCYRATNVTNGLIAWVAASRLWVLSTEDGTFYNRSPNRAFYDDVDYIQESQLEFSNPGDSGYAVSLPSGKTPDGGLAQHYDGGSGKLVAITSGSGSSCVINVNAFAGAGVTLATIVGDILQGSGLRPDQFDVSDGANTPVAGYGYAELLDVKGIIGQLQQIYLFDMIERDALIVLRMRGTTTTPDETISYKVLAATGGGNNENTADFWKETRLSEADIPASVTLTYLNSDQDMEQATANSQRILAPVPMVFSRQTDQVSANIVFTATDAKNRATAMLYSLWSERTKHVSKLPPAYAYLDPSDLLSVNLADGSNYFERLMHTEFGADFSSNIETIGQDSGAYTWDLTGDGGSGQGQTLKTPFPARPFIFNVPYLRDIDNILDGQASIYYEAVGNESPNGFNGATLFQSTNGVNFVTINHFTADSEWGVVPAVTPPAARGNFALDWNTKVIIWPAVDSFDLQSISDATLWAGGNMCMLGEEVIQFRDAVQNLDGSWTIWNLIRGCRGTEWACDNHTTNESFVFLALSSLKAGTEGLTVIGSPLWWKAVGAGMNNLDIAPMVHVDAYPGNDLRPYSPVELAAAWSGGDIDITFTRRTRFGGGLLDGTGTVPINETKEAYQVDIYNGADVIRTLSADFGSAGTPTPSVTYAAADIATDWGSTPVELKIAVYQMGIVTRGFGKTETLTLTGSPSPTARYWGASSLTSLAESDILALGNQDLAINFDKDITFDCTGGKYPYYCFPATYGTPTAVTVNGLPFTAFSVTTVSVGGNSYNVLRFDNIQHGASIPTHWA